VTLAGTCQISKSLIKPNELVMEGDAVGAIVEADCEKAVDELIIILDFFV
jgi:hypothetical protein